MEIYGVRVEDTVRHVQLDKLTRHHLNPLRIKQKDSQEISRVFLAEIKTQGVIEPILITPAFEVIRGWRRVTASIKAGHKTIPARMCAANLPDSALRKLIFRDNTQRENYSEPEIDEILLKAYGKHRIMEALKSGRGAGAKNQKIPLHRQVEEEIGIPVGSAKRHLSRLRKRLLSEETHRAPSITESEKKFGMRLAREHRINQRTIERAMGLIHKLEEKTISPARKKNQAIEKELRPLGGHERFLRLL